MLSIFRSNSIVLSILLVPYALLLRSFGFFRNIQTEFDNGGLLADFIYENIKLGQTVSVVVSFVLLLLQAVLLISISHRHKLSDEDNLYTGMFYVLIGSVSIYFLGLTPALIGNTFLIIAMMNLFGLFREKEPSGFNFAAGFWLAMAALSYGSLSLFFLYGIIALNIIRAFSIKEMLQLVCGYLVPFILLFTYFYAIGDTMDSFFPYILGFLSILDFRENIEFSTFIPISILAVVLIGLVVNYGTLTEKQSMKSRKNIVILWVFILFSLLGIFIQSGVWIEHLISLAIPFSILLSLLFTRMKSVFWKEVCHSLLFLTIPITHYFLT